MADMGEFSRNNAALKYLVLHMNTLQKSFEFEFLHVPFDDPYIKSFSDRTVVDHAELSKPDNILAFLRRYQQYLDNQMQGMSEQEQPENFVLVTTARLDTNWYSFRQSRLAVLALGNWDEVMYPPSLIESILTLIVRQAVGLVSQSLKSSVHLGTRGCLCDFNSTLDEVRLHVLNGFICGHCRSVLQADGFPQMADDLLPVLKRNWLGNLADPHAPVRVAANLGYNLFITKGFTTTRRERIFAKLADQGTSQAFGIIAAVVIAYILFHAGLG